jgi:hypothetical protein
LVEIGWLEIKYGQYHPTSLAHGKYKTYLRGPDRFKWDVDAFREATQGFDKIRVAEPAPKIKKKEERIFPPPPHLAHLV